MKAKGVRELLEPFKFLSTSTIACTLPLVCRRWRFISSLSELWTFLRTRDSGHDLGVYASPYGEGKLDYYYALYSSQRELIVLVNFPCAELRVVNVEKWAVKPVDLGRLLVNMNPSWCYLPMGGVLVCGGNVENTTSRASLMLVGTMYSPIATGALIEPRKQHTLCRVATTVYAFGGAGNDGDLSSCEKFQLDQQRWQLCTSLPGEYSNLSAAYAPSCGILLLHSSIPTKFLLFHLKSESFEPCQFRFLSNMDAVSMLVYKSSLIILAREFGVRCDIPSHMQQHRFSLPANLPISPSSPPLLLGSKAYFALSSYQVLALDVDKCSTKVLPLAK